MKYDKAMGIALDLIKDSELYWQSKQTISVDFIRSLRERVAGELLKAFQKGVAIGRRLPDTDSQEGETK